MEDELGQGNRGGISQSPSRENLQNETLKMGSGNLVEETNYEEGDDGEEIMVESVGSDVFVDGVGENKEGDLDSAEITGMYGHIPEEIREPKTADIPGAMDVSGKWVENKRENESGVEKKLVAMDGKWIGKIEIGFSDSGDRKRHVVTNESKMGENEVVTEGSKGESDLRLPESRDETDYVVTVAMDVYRKGDGNLKGKSELGLPKSGDEESIVFKEVCSEGDANRPGAGKSGNEKDYIFTQYMDCNSGEPENVEAGVSSVQTQEGIQMIQLVISKDKTVKDEAVDEKCGLSDQPVLNSVSSNVASEKVGDTIFNFNGKGPENYVNNIITCQKRKNTPKDSLDSRKERSLTESIGANEYENNVDESSGKKQKALDSLTDGYDKRLSIYAVKVSTLTSLTPKNKPSFKIGECISRGASQLTGSGRDQTVIYEQQKRLSVESFSVDEMLTRLEGVAQEPRRRHDLISVVRVFFTGFRRSMVLNRQAREKRAEQGSAGKQDSSPAELILSFAQRNSIPSEIILNKMFRRFGPLMESETKVDHESGSAKVIFKRGCDAEVARDSSERCDIFGAGLVKYHIGYEPLISVRVLPLMAPPRPLEDVTFVQ